MNEEFKTKSIEDLNAIYEKFREEAYRDYVATLRHQIQALTNRLDALEADGMPADFGDTEVDQIMNSRSTDNSLMMPYHEGSVSCDLNRVFVSLTQAKVDVYPLTDTPKEQSK